MLVKENTAASNSKIAYEKNKTFFLVHKNPGSDLTKPYINF